MNDPRNPSTIRPAARRRRRPSSPLSRRDALKLGLCGSLTAGLAPGLLMKAWANSRGEKRPNIFLISVDTLRADHLGCYGYGRATSPHVDRFAKESVLFENCFSHAPLTGSSLASLLSGFLPHETKVYGNRALPRKVTLLPETLGAHGYRTMAVVSNYVLRRNRGWADRFDVYDATMDDREQIRNKPERIAPNTTRAAIRLLEPPADGPIFLWTHYQDPHGPYTPPPPYDEMFRDGTGRARPLRVNGTATGYGGIPSYQALGSDREYDHYVSRYDGEIRFMDESLRDLFAGLKRLGLYEDSLILFTADHGEGMGEHDYFFAHGENLDRGLTRVPLLLRAPGAAPVRRNDYVQHLDVVPTLLRAAGVPAPDGLRGHDLGDGGAPAREIYAEAEVRGRDEKVITASLIVGGLKLMDDRSALPEIRHRLFDLRRDPGEEHDLSEDEEYRSRMERMAARRAEIGEENRIDHEVTTRPEELTEEEKKNLEALGYVE